MVKKKTFFQQPGKNETLAGKQEARIKRWRLNHFYQRWGGFSQKWWLRIGEMVGIGVLLLLSFWLLWPFFGQEDKVNAFSAPVIPLLAALTERFTPFAYGVRLWLLVFLVFFPLSFYYLVREVSGRRLIGFLAAALTILPAGIFLPSRVELALLVDDGGHIASLTMTPIVCLWLLKFLRKGRFWSGILAALTTAIVALTSPIGLVVLGVFMGVMAFSELLLGQARLKMLRFLATLVLAAGFCAFWYHPGFVLLTFLSPQGQLIKKTFFNLLPVSFFLVPILGVFGFLLFENRPQLQPLFVAFFLTIVFGLFSLGAGITPALPSRFWPAFGISLSFLVGILLGWLFDFIRFSPRLRRVRAVASHRQIIAAGMIGLVFILIGLMIFLYGRRWSIAETQILDLSAGQKVGIWEVREKASRVESLFGYLITGLAILGVVILRLKVI